MSQASTQETPPTIEKTIPDLLLSIKRFLLTHLRLFKNPGDFITKRRCPPKDIVNPSTFLFEVLCIFFLLATFFPLFSEPNVKTQIGQATQATQDFIRMHGPAGIMWLYLVYIVLAVIGIIAAVVLCYLSDWSETVSMLGVAAYMTVAVLDLLILHYFLVLLIIKFCVIIRHLNDLMAWRIYGIRFPDMILYFLIYPVPAMATYLWKEKEDDKLRVALFMALYTGVIVSVGYYFVKAVDTNRHTITAPIPPAREIPLPPIKKDSSLPVEPPPVAKEAKIQETAPVAADANSDIPDNTEILITPVIKSDSLIHIRARHMYGRYWLETSYTFTNLTHTIVFFPKGDSIWVNMSLGSEALRTCDNVHAKCFLFTPAFPAGQQAALEGDSSKQLFIKYRISRRMYAYIHYQCRRKQWLDHRIFVGLNMRANGGSFVVNHQNHWDIDFNQR